MITIALYSAYMKISVDLELLTRGREVDLQCWGISDYRERVEFVLEKLEIREKFMMGRIAVSPACGKYSSLLEVGLSPPCNGKNMRYGENGIIFSGIATQKMNKRVIKTFICKN